MKTFRVLLRGRDDEFVQAERYRLAGAKYVFESEADTEVRFFLADEVVGIEELTPDEPEPNWKAYY